MTNIIANSDINVIAAKQGRHRPLKHRRHSSHQNTRTLEDRYMGAQRHGKTRTQENLNNTQITKTKDEIKTTN